MGCDIHIVVEAFSPEQDIWVGLHNCPSIITWLGSSTAPQRVWWEITSRDYGLFAALAGVRGEDEDFPDVEPRGVPEDASALARMEIQGWGGDGHSHSYGTVRELLPIIRKYWANYVAEKVKGQDKYHKSVGTWEAVRIGDLLGIDLMWRDNEALVKPYDDPTLTLEELVKPEVLDHHRLVFWFDN